MEINKSPTPDKFPILGSLLVKSSSVYRGSYITDDSVTGDNPNGSEFSIFLRRKKRGPVHMKLAKEEFEKFMLMKIIKNDVSFSLVESESFGDSVDFLRDDAPNITRGRMKRRLDAMYEKGCQTLKEKLYHNTGKFSITIDEWRSGNNLDFSRITLHFYNKSELEMDI